jgi:raffinose/stachyose/melibiose transport system substrate-binding protein
VKKTFLLFLAVLMSLSLAAGCGGASGASGTSSDASQVYFLNFKPEISEVYAEIAAAYEEETGVAIKVGTAAAGMYESTLRSEIAKADAPTIFQINGPVGYEGWSDYCLDLSGTGFYNMLNESGKSLAVASGGGVYGVPYVVEGYGIIYNDAIMRAYFALPGAVARSMDEVNNFAKLKALTEDMSAKKEQLGIDGVFASTSMAAGEQWRWQTHLANLPLYYEFKDDTAYDNTVLAGLAAETIAFKYNQNFKNTFDLYTDHSVSGKGLLGNVSVNDSMAEFALGRAAMVQNGNWGAAQILGVPGNTVEDADIKFLPIYTGMAGEENQGLCVGTENFFAVNSQVSAEKQEASLAFLEWLFSSETGKAFVKNDLMFIAPFDTFDDDEKPEDPLGREVLAWMDKPGISTVAWTFAAFPSEEFKNYFGDALLEYVQGSETWEDVTNVVVDSWASERALNPVGS